MQINVKTADQLKTKKFEIFTYNLQLDNLNQSRKVNQNHLKQFNSY